VAVTTYPGTVTPLRGLAAFTEAECDVFWGRERERDELTKLVTGDGYRAGLLHGPAGVGKTSLLRAGLIPHLRDHGVVAMLCRDNMSPAASLAAEYSRATSHAPSEGESPVAFLARAAASALRGQQYLFILDDVDSALASRDEAVISEIADLFARVVTRSSGRARFLFCCESDQLHNFGILERRTGSLFPPSSRIQLEPMAIDEASEVFERMLSLGAITADPNLARAVVGQLNHGAPVSPADLQIAAMAIRDLGATNMAAIDHLGGGSELPKAWLDSCAAQTGDRGAALRLLSQMAEGRGKAQVTADWIARRANLIPDYVTAALEQLGGRGVLDALPSAHGEERRYQLAHQVLAPRIRDLAAPAKAAAKRAFELLGSKAESGGRLRLFEWLEVRRLRLAPANNQERAVIERTKRFAKLVAGLAVAVPIAFLILIYIFMAGRYYLDSATIDGAERVVVRDGRPGLSMFNWMGFGDVVADTGFSRRMVVESAWDDIAGEDVTFGGGGAVDAAIDALEPEVAKLLQYAIDGSETALEGLIAESTPPEVAAEILDTLGSIGRGGPKEIELVVAALGHESPSVRISALRLAAEVEQRRPNTYRSTLVRALASARAEQRRLAASVVRGLPEELSRPLWSAALERASGEARGEILARTISRPTAEINPAELASVVANPDSEKAARESARERLYRLLAARPETTAASVASVAANAGAPTEERVRALAELFEHTPKEAFEEVNAAVSDLAESSDEKLRAAALPLVAKLDPKTAAGDLAVMTESKDKLSPALKAALALSWGEVANVNRNAAIAALEILVEDAEPEVKRAAARAFGKLGRVSQSTLIDMVKKERLDVAEGAAFGLVESARAGASASNAAAGINQLWKKKGRAKRHAAEAFALLAGIKPRYAINYAALASRDDADGALHEIGIQGLCNALAAGSSRATGSMLRAADGASTALRQQIAECASDILEAQPGSAFELAANLLGDSNAGVRLESIKVIARLAKGDGVDAKKIGPLVVKALGDPIRAVRTVAAEALADLGASAPEGVGEKLVAAFAAAGEGEKLALLRAGTAIGETALVSLAAGDPSERVRIAGLDAALVDRAVAQSSIEAALTDPSARVRTAALDTLAAARGKLSAAGLERALALAIRDTDVSIATRALTLLAALGDPKAVGDRLERLLGSRSDRTRERAANACVGLADTDPGRAVELLEPRLRDASRDVRAAAALSLGAALAAREKVDALIDRLRGSERRPAMRIAVAAALADLGRGENKELVTKALGELADKSSLSGLTARVVLGLLDSGADARAFLRWLAP
jgi:HEAT repeat protein